MYKDHWTYHTHPGVTEHVLSEAEWERATARVTAYLGRLDLPAEQCLRIAALAGERAAELARHRRGEDFLALVMEALHEGLAEVLAPLPGRSEKADTTAASLDGRVAGWLAVRSRCSCQDEGSSAAPAGPRAASWWQRQAQPRIARRSMAPKPLERSFLRRLLLRLNPRRHSRLADRRRLLPGF